MFAYGTWELRPRAWALGIVLEVIVLVLAVLQPGRLELARHTVTIVIAGVAPWYLTTPRVRAAFGRSQAKDGGIPQRAIDKRPPNDFGAAFSADHPRWQPAGPVADQLSSWLGR